MDPNRTLEEIRLLLLDISDQERSPSDKDEALDCLAVRVEALDQWISDGGFLPTAWTMSATGRGPVGS